MVRGAGAPPCENILQKCYLYMYYTHSKSNKIRITPASTHPLPNYPMHDPDPHFPQRVPPSVDDSTVHGHRHPGQYQGPKQRSGMDMRQRPTGAPSRTRSARWRSHSQPDLEAPRTALPSCPSSSLQTPTKDQDQPDPLTTTGTLQTQPRTRIQVSAGTRGSTHEPVCAYLIH